MMQLSLRSYENNEHANGMRNGFVVLLCVPSFVRRPDSLVVAKGFVQRGIVCIPTVGRIGI